VFKALAETRVKIDILAGKSIGGINTAIIAGSKSTLQGKSGFLIYMRIQTLHRQE
jgi:predicted acylesterase/phospholipase RssA